MGNTDKSTTSKAIQQPEGDSNSRTVLTGELVNPPVVSNPVDSDTSGVGDALTDQRRVRSDARMAAKAIRYGWMNNRKRSILQQRLWEANTRAAEDCDTRSLVATATALLTCDRITLAANPAPKQVEHTGEVRHNHAVVTLPAKALPALPAAEST